MMSSEELDGDDEFGCVEADVLVCGRSRMVFPCIQPSFPSMRIENQSPLWSTHSTFVPLGIICKTSLLGSLDFRKFAFSLMTRARLPGNTTGAELLADTALLAAVSIVFLALAIALSTSELLFLFDEIETSVLDEHESKNRIVTHVESTHVESLSKFIAFVRVALQKYTFLLFGN